MSGEHQTVENQIRTFSKNEDLVSERREHIVDSTLALFLQKGYHATTMREISEATGLAPGALYRYIGSKEDILHLIAQRRALTLRELRDRMEEIQGASTTEVLKVCIRNYIYMSDRDKNIVLFFNREIGYMAHDDRREILGSAVNGARFFEEILLKGIEEGEFKNAHPLSLAHDIFMLGQNYALRNWFINRYYTLEEYIEIHLDGILRQLGVGLGVK
jgi:AcrR family transcriptional regulator